MHEGPHPITRLMWGEWETVPRMKQLGGTGLRGGCAAQKPFRINGGGAVFFLKLSKTKKMETFGYKPAGA